MSDRIQIRRGTKNQWEEANPILAEGESGLEKIEGAEAGYKEKIGNGLYSWKDLPYHVTGSGSSISGVHISPDIGLCCVSTTSPNQTYGSWVYIDKDCKDVVLPAKYLETHPVFGGMETVLIDGQYMVRVPKFYVKTGVVSSGKYIGKNYRCISSEPENGFHVHPAFMKNGQEIDAFYIAAYISTQDSGGKPVSLPRRAIVATGGVEDTVTGLNPNQRFNWNVTPWCESRNSGGVSGFSQIDIHQWSALHWLLFIEAGTLNPSTLNLLGLGSGGGNTDQVPCWRGIYGLCSYEQVLNGIYQAVVSGNLYTDQVTSSVPRIFDAMGTRNYINVSNPEISSVTKDWAFTSGSGYNFADILLNTFTAASTTGGFSNGYFSNSGLPFKAKANYSYIYTSSSVLTLVAMTYTSTSAPQGYAFREFLDYYKVCAPSAVPSIVTSGYASRYYTRLTKV